MDKKKKRPAVTMINVVKGIFEAYLTFMLLQAFKDTTSVTLHKVAQRFRWVLHLAGRIRARKEEHGSHIEDSKYGESSPVA